MKGVLLFVIRVYQGVVSPFLGDHCRFYPSCSQFSLRVIKKYTLVTALYFIGRRLLRCQPFYAYPKRGVL